MRWLLTAWGLVRDILLTCTGLWLIISQVGARSPSPELIVAGLALTVPAAATHAKEVLSGSPAIGHGPSESSPSSPSPSSSPALPPAGGTDAG